MRYLVKVKSDNILNEIKVQDISFKGKKFLRAISQIAYGLGPDVAEEFEYEQSWFIDNIRHELLTNVVPDDIEEKEQGESLNWLKKMVVKNEDSYSDLVESQINQNRVRAALEAYFRYKKVAPVKKAMLQTIQEEGFYDAKKGLNLIYFPSLESLKRTVGGRALKAYIEYMDHKQYMDAKEGTKKIYEDDEWTIYIPENRGAACELGKKTNWCTAMTDSRENFYETYHSPDNPLFIFINKKNPEEKYQFSYKAQDFANRGNENIITLGQLGKHRFLHNLLLRAGMDKQYPDVFKENYWSEDGFHGLEIDKSWKIWRLNGEIHREDGPAVITKSGLLQWRLYGEIHRVDGPATIRPDGEKEWWLNYKKYESEEEWRKALEKQNLKEHFRKFLIKERKCQR